MADELPRFTSSQPAESTDELFRRIVAAADAEVSGANAPRPVGRPAMGSAPAEVVAVRLDPELHRRLLAQLSADGVSASDLMRTALKLYLAARAA